jgi:DNA polymerase III subunit epsilon
VKRTGSVLGDARPPAYDDLRARTLAALLDTPDGLTDAQLAAAIFGTTAGSRWTALLPAVLHGDSRFVRVSDRWFLATLSETRARGSLARGLDRQAVADLTSTAGVLSPDLPAPLPLRTAALALATTGADPRHHHIAHIALVCLDGDQIVARLDTPVRPERELPRYLQTAVRTSTDDLESAPTFAEVCPQLQELTGGQIVHTYGARRATEFFAAAAEHAGVTRPGIELIEADLQIRPLLPARCKPGLLAAAREMNVPYSRPGLPLSDAETLARVLVRVRQRQQVAPIRTADPMADPVNPSCAPDPPDERQQARRPLPFTRAWLTSVPDAPGAYLFADERGRVLYVGKARSLYRRLASYVQRQPAKNRHLEALAVRTARAEAIVAPSDLEATLLEARLIDAHTPEFNVARSARPPLTILRAGLDDPSPRIQQVADVRPDGARYFGPLESGRAAREALETVRAVYPAAVARRRGDVAAQRAAVLDACRLLSGQRSEALELLQRDMARAASRGDATEVNRLRSALRNVQALDMRPSLLVGMRADARLLVLEHVSEGVTRAHLLQDGARLVSVSWGMDFLPSEAHRLRELADAMLAAAECPSDDHDAAVAVASGPPDPAESSLVMRWLLQARTRIEIALVPPIGD